MCTILLHSYLHRGPGEVVVEHLEYLQDVALPAFRAALAPVATATGIEIYKL